MERQTVQWEFMLPHVDLFLNAGGMTKFKGLLEFKLADAIENIYESDEFTEVKRVYNKIPRSAWINYKHLEITGQTEQKLMANAITNFVKRMKEEINKSKKQTEE